jgi:hypothetical protein
MPRARSSADAAHGDRIMTKVHKRAPARRPLPPVYELAAFSVFGFCLAHGLSRRKLYYMLEAGEGPRIMKCGTRTLISVEAAQRWRRARERMAAVSRRRCGGHRIRKLRTQHCEH